MACISVQLEGTPGVGGPLEAVDRPGAPLRRGCDTRHPLPLPPVLRRRREGGQRPCPPLLLPARGQPWRGESWISQKPPGECRLFILIVQAQGPGFLPQDSGFRVKPWGLRGRERLRRAAVPHSLPRHAALKAAPNFSGHLPKRLAARSGGGTHLLPPPHIRAPSVASERRNSRRTGAL